MKVKPELGGRKIMQGRVDKVLLGTRVGNKVQGTRFKVQERTAG